MKWGAYYKQSRAIRFLSNRRNLVGSHPQEQWETLCSFFDGICPRCQKATDKFTRDHIQPLSRGGTHNIENIQPLCLSCNVEKSNLYVTDYRPEFVVEWANKMIKEKE